MINRNQFNKPNYQSELDVACLDWAIRGVRYYLPGGDAYDPNDESDETLHFIWHQERRESALKAEFKRLTGQDYDDIVMYI